MKPQRSFMKLISAHKGRKRLRLCSSHPNPAELGNILQLGQICGSSQVLAESRL